MTKTSKVLAVILVGGALGIIAFNPAILAKLDTAMHSPEATIKAHNVPTASLIATAKADAAETTEARIEAKKWQIVDDLASQCETKTVKEPDSAIIFDSNNAASIGAWQYQIKTVQAYAQIHLNRTLTRTEAIALAIDHNAARELTYKIIWNAPNSDKGIDNWYNCAHNKSDFAARVQYIKQVEKDFISPITK
ncbi:MAG: hypothetical protein KBD16_00670 [Candidatus Pacebacteria bacterium]|nr:hypothetical protein [Candidatus Paceibacterota bacterium]